MNEEAHSEIGSLGVEVFHEPKWETVFGRPYNSFFYGEKSGTINGTDEFQKCKYCDKHRNHYTSAVSYFY